ASTSIPPAAESNVIALAAASSPFIITLPASESIVTSIPAPVVLKLESVSDVRIFPVPTPVADIFVNSPELGVVPPIAGGAANTAAKFDGVTKRASAPVDGVPATASTSVANSPIPGVVSVDTGDPAIAKLSAYVLMANELDAVVFNAPANVADRKST